MRSNGPAAAGWAPPIRAAKAPGWRNRIGPVKTAATRANRAGPGETMRQIERFPNLVAMFFARAAEKGAALFVGSRRQGEWRWSSWRETAERVARLAAALKGLGLARGDRVM